MKTDDEDQDTADLRKLIEIIQPAQYRRDTLELVDVAQEALDLVRVRLTELYAENDRLRQELGEAKELLEQRKGPGQGSE